MIEIPFVNDGRPFTLDKKYLTPGLQEAGLRAKLAVLKDVGRDFADIPSDLRGDLQKEVHTQANLAQANAMVHAILCKVDASVKRMSQQDMMDRLDVDAYKAIMDAIDDLSPGGSELPKDPTGGVIDADRPLETKSAE